MITSLESMNTLRMIMMREAQTKEDKTPSIKLCPASFLNVCHSVLKALSKIRHGKKIARMPLGSTFVIK